MSLKIIDNHLLISVAIVSLSALLISLGAVNAVVDTWRGAGQVQKQAAKIDRLPKLARTAAPMDDSYVSALAKRLAILHPTVKIVSGPQGKLTISIDNGANYSEWRAAVADLLQSDLAGASVDTEAICGVNCGGSYCTSEFIIRRVSYDVT